MDLVLLITYYFNLLQAAVLKNKWLAQRLGGEKILNLIVKFFVGFYIFYSLRNLFFSSVVSSGSGRIRNFSPYPDPELFGFKSVNSGCRFQPKFTFVRLLL